MGIQSMKAVLNDTRAGLQKHLNNLAALESAPKKKTRKIIKDIQWENKIISDLQQSIDESQQLIERHEYMLILQLIIDLYRTATGEVQ